MFDPDRPGTELRDVAGRYAIVGARFHGGLVQQMVASAHKELDDHGVSTVDVYHVPGAFELPGACARLCERYDAIIAFGCVIRGDTPHFDYVCAETARGLGELNLRQPTPVIFGVLTCDTREQAEERADPKGENKGGEAAVAAMEMVQLNRGIQQDG